MIDEALIEQLNRGYVCPPDAGPEWRAACEYGFDMSLVEDALNKSPEERIEAHQRMLNMILMLEGGQNPRGAESSGSLLKCLKEHEVEFVIIGGVCGVLHGLPMVTFDLDICCPFSIESLRRIADAVKHLHPCHRLTANKLPLELTDDMGSRLKNLYLQTDMGMLDCLSEVAGIGDYQQVLKRSIPHNTSYGEFRILSIEALIAAKEAVGRERDITAVKFLRAIKEKRRPH
jgi:hypothetical protein